MKIGIAGVGRMGSAIAERLLAQGHEVLVWNRTPARAEALVPSGAVPCPSPAALAAAAEVVLTILTDAAAIEAVYGGPDGLLAAPLAGKLVIDMSTVRPETARALAGRVRAAGAAFVECPVGGTVAPARDGKLFGLAGGDAAEVARARPILETLCRRVEHVGPVGAGASMKLAINLPLAVYWQALGEALALCRDVGLDGAQLVGILADTSGGPTVLRNRAEVVARVLDGARVPGTVDGETLLKDLDIMLAEAEALGARLPVAEAAAAGYREGIAAGFGKLDGSHQSAFWRDRGAG
jgi:3-hydroxyisobutyrate dehydrogenase